jgi:hypothetical protein
MSSTDPANSCANCRFHSASMRPKPHTHADDLMDGTFFVADDEPQKVYMCRAEKSEAAPRAGQEIGAVPVLCDAWQGARPPTERDTRMYEQLLAWRQRQSDRRAEEAADVAVEPEPNERKPE